MQNYVYETDINTIMCLCIICLYMMISNVRMICYGHWTLKLNCAIGSVCVCVCTCMYECVCEWE